MAVMTSSETTPAWVRPLYLYLVCLVGNLVMIYGAVTFVTGVITAAVPRTDTSPVTQIGHAVVDVVEDVVIGLSDAPPEIQDGLEAARSGINKQARNRGVSRTVYGGVVFLAGLATFMVAWRRANESPRPAPAMAPWTAGPSPYAQPTPQQPLQAPWAPPPQPPPAPPAT